MGEPTKEFTVLDLLPLVAGTVKERLGQLGEIERTDARTGQVNKQAARERLQLLFLAIRALEIVLGGSGLAPTKNLRVEKSVIDKLLESEMLADIKKLTRLPKD